MKTNMTFNEKEAQTRMAFDSAKEQGMEVLRIRFATPVRQVDGDTVEVLVHRLDAPLIDDKAVEALIREHGRVKAVEMVEAAMNTLMQQQVAAMMRVLG